MADASAASLHAFVTDQVEPGARVITDGWLGRLPRVGEARLRPRPAQPDGRPDGRGRPQRTPSRGAPGRASLGKRWLLGTHQGSVGDAARGRLPERVRVPLQPPRCITNCISAARRPSRWSTRCDRCSTGKCSTAETSMCTSVAGRYRARGALEPLQCDSWFHSRAGAWRYHLHRWSARFRHPTDARALLRVLVVGKEVDSHELLRTL